MKTPEDEAFDDLARNQGAWGGGFPAKKAMAADKLQEPVQEPVIYTWGDCLESVARVWGALGPSTPLPVQEPPSAYESLVRDMTTIAAREVPRGVPIAEFAMHALADAERRSRTIPPLPAQEPVALVIDGVLVKSALPEKYTGHLYTAPPQREWVGLTDDEIWGAVSRIGTSNSDVNPHQTIHDARAIEAKLKEKNT